SCRPRCIDRCSLVIFPSLVQEAACHWDRYASPCAGRGASPPLSRRRSSHKGLIRSLGPLFGLVVSTDRGGHARDQGRHSSVALGICAPLETGGDPITFEIAVCAGGVGRLDVTRIKYKVDGRTVTN